MNSYDKTDTAYELNFNIDEVSIYVFKKGRDVTGRYYPEVSDGKGLVGFWLPANTETDNLLNQYRYGQLTVEPRQFARVLGELHRRAGRIERAERDVVEVQHDIRS